MITHHFVSLKGTSVLKTGFLLLLGAIWMVMSSRKDPKGRRPQRHTDPAYRAKLFLARAGIGPDDARLIPRPPQQPRQTGAHPGTTRGKYTESSTQLAFEQSPRLRVPQRVFYHRWWTLHLHLSHSPHGAPRVNLAGRLLPAHALLAPPPSPPPAVAGRGTRLDSLPFHPPTAFPV